MRIGNLARNIAATASTLWLAFTCRVALAADPFGGGKLKEVGGKVYGSAADADKASNLTGIIGNLIKTAIGLLGIIFLILIVYAGYLWLTARGDEKQVTKAKDTLQRALIGIIIVLAAYALTTYLFTRLAGAVTGTVGESSALE